MGVELDIIPVADWFTDISDYPVIISGPCSAESYQQVVDTAEQLHKTGKVNVFRAGVWKPRTRPNSFEGVGEIAFEWLKEVKDRFGFKIAVEVASKEHVRIALRNKVDILWIGARTASNPFSMTELATELAGTDIPVLVKNPVNPDIELWIGALERLNKAGIKKIAAIHRGFFPFEPSQFRNIPLWEVPIELKLRCPQLSIINDPSHIAGDRALLYDVAQKAMDLDFCGLMIESHCSPDKAKSDAKQQVTPDDLNALLSKLVIRNNRSSDKSYKDQIDAYRKQIDEIDDRLLNLLWQRMDVVRRIGDIKNRNDVKILQLNRWESLVRKLITKGTRLGLSEVFIKKLLQLVHKESIQQQAEVMNKKED
ncbi:MAG: bifunctional 3-deoxy-7-phosphoheptulonate synthase/chorismate mutase type II [Bacteroidales bacterium]|jgi:chorismate mutase|nr:bifunctional 3-deoxy-7-phosphoheptulonate synthase/chorismate mutase type II [Bacteroidales bacterium]